MKLKPTATPRPWRRFLWRVGPVALLLVLIAALVYLSGPGTGLTPSGSEASVARSAATSVDAAPPVTPRESTPLRLPQSVPVAAALSAEAVNPAAVTETSTGAILQQTFTLSAGWNAIYLGVEPINTSEVISSTHPELGHKLSLMQLVFGNVAGLESVWTYNQPVSSKDYIIDPSEGLWDEPGWARYVPESNYDANGQSMAFLTNLHTLHANTGYLVKLKDGATSEAITVAGKPVPGHHRWQPGAYNLAGFPIGPGQAPTVATFTGGGSGAITEIRSVSTDGKWTAPMAGTAALAPGTAYLVRYAAEPAVVNYTAPLDLASEVGGALPSDGLKLDSGKYGRSATLMVKNLTGASVSDIQLALLPAPGVSLYYAKSDDESTALSPTVPIVAPITLVTTPPGNAALLKFFVQDQASAGEALLSISSSSLGTRWLIPVSAAALSHAGLWVGDVAVNDVSEARLGATDETELTVQVKAMNSSEVKGTADLKEITLAGPSYKVQIAMTVTLPSATPPAATDPVVAPPYVHGRVFVDTNQNGKSDRTEPGLANVEVKFTAGSTEKIATTGADGSYWVPDMSAGAYTAGITAPAGYTGNFQVEIPPATLKEPPLAPTRTTNTAPATVTTDALGTTAVTPPEYLQQVLAPPYTMPLKDENGQRVEPPLNFGYVRQDEAGIYGGPCDKPRERIFPSPGDAGWQVINGIVTAEVSGKLNDLIGTNTTNNISVLRGGQVIACGELVVGSPTAFSDGRGSEARFRIILRVNESGKAEVLPYYVLADGKRISAVNFLSLQAPEQTSGSFGQPGVGMLLDWRLAGNDPLNPFKHKYNPDHDNLDRAFAPIKDSASYESYDVDRSITLTLTDLPAGGDQAFARSVDWGGTTWGGDYREVLSGLHRNDITVRGTFTIRKVVANQDLRKQDYDK